MKIQHITVNIDLAASSRIKEEFNRALMSIEIASKNYVEGEVSITVISPDAPCVVLPAWVEEKKIETDARQSFGKPEMYPLIPGEHALKIIDPEVDYVVLSNPDISVAPDFYNRVARYASSRAKSLNIHRETIPDVDGEIAQFQLLPAETIAHEGSDCFVFCPEEATRFVLGKLVIGMSPIDDVLLINMKLQNESFVRLQGQQLTFHYGDERSWKSDVRSPFFPQSFEFGRRAVAELLSRYGNLRVFNASLGAGVFFETWRYVVLPAMFPAQSTKFYTYWSYRIRNREYPSSELFARVNGAVYRRSAKNFVSERLISPATKLIRQSRMRRR